MSDFKNISDDDIRNLLKKRLVEETHDDDLLEAEAKLVFSSVPLVAPSALKEKELLEKLTADKPTKQLKKWMLPGLLILSIFPLLYYGLQKTDPLSKFTVKNNSVNGQELTASHDTKSYALQNKKDLSKTNLIKNLPESKYRGQVIETILKENADCTSPLIVKDTIVFCPHSPKGSGNEMEISDNLPTDKQYFENEHNTIWYKYTAQETGQLTFDIIPVDLNDDYDFMLFKWDGGDFRSKVLTKKIKPIRTCISRNDKKIKSMTGLSLDPMAESYVHSGEGASYVKYINVQKGQNYYLLVDNVYNNGNGHTIHFHIHPFKEGELFLGQQILFEHITFKDSDDEFKQGSEAALDSLYKFLILNPKIKIEIQGHVNASNGNNPRQIPGKPAYSDLELSQNRALAIYKFLVKKGIDPQRLTTIGYGGTRRRMEKPRTKEECYMNIRAEILILSLDYKKDLDLIKRP